MAANVSIGFTSTDPHPSGGLRVWSGLQTINEMFTVNTFSYAYLATFAMPALARSGVRAMRTLLVDLLCTVLHNNVDCVQHVSFMQTLLKSEPSSVPGRKQARWTVGGCDVSCRKNWCASIVSTLTNVDSWKCALFFILNAVIPFAQDFLRLRRTVPRSMHCMASSIAFV